MWKIKGILDQYEHISKQNTFQVQPDEINKNIRKEICNILEGTGLADFIELLTQQSAIHSSDNIGNNFEIEKEIKILDVNQSELVEKITRLGGKTIFTGLVDDFYLDLPDKKLENMSDKVSFRLRVKMSKNGELKLYYTIKKKKPKNKNGLVLTRDCYEKEFEIVNKDFAFQVLAIMQNHLGLHLIRRKTKERTAMILDNIKFDFDTYKHIPTLLEIETDTTENIPGIMQILGLSENTTLNTGSRGLYKYYNVYEMYDYFTSNDLEFPKCIFQNSAKWV